MRIALSAGHNVYINGIFDPGAVSYPYVEADLNKEAVALLIPMLERQGHTVLDVTPYNEHFKSSKEHHVLRCKRVDEFKADIFIDVHHNASGGSGTGSEIWIHNVKSPSYPYAREILNNLGELTGLRKRGVLVKPTFWSVSLTKAPAMITEGGFVDSKVDMEKLTPLKYATAIAKCFGEVKEDKSDLIKINLHGQDIEIEGIIGDGIIHVPIRFIERLGYKVTWKDGKVYINYKKG